MGAMLCHATGPTWVPSWKVNAYVGHGWHLSPSL